MARARRFRHESQHDIGDWRNRARPAAASSSGCGLVISPCELVRGRPRCPSTGTSPRLGQAPWPTSARSTSPTTPTWRFQGRPIHPEVHGCRAFCRRDTPGIAFRAGRARGATMRTRRPRVRRGMDRAARELVQSEFQRRAISRADPRRGIGVAGQHHPRAVSRCRRHRRRRGGGADRATPCRRGVRGHGTPALDLRRGDR